jgi:hypothetical protein
MRLTVSMPCYGRPQRTIRAIENVADQNINGWEALIVGDGCPKFQDLWLSGAFMDVIEHCKQNGNKIFVLPNSVNKGGWGYDIINRNIQRAVGKYFMFMSNDDIIKPNHFENYLSGIENTDYDFVYYDSYVEAYGDKRNAQLRSGSIGHSELIVRTEFLKQMPPHTPNYGHDWELIENMIKAGAKYTKIHSEPTYIVKGVGDYRIDTID